MRVLVFEVILRSGAVLAADRRACSNARAARKRTHSARARTLPFLRARRKPSSPWGTILPSLDIRDMDINIDNRLASPLGCEEALVDLQVAGEPAFRPALIGVLADVAAPMQGPYARGVACKRKRVLHACMTPHGGQGERYRAAHRERREDEVGHTRWEFSQAIVSAAVSSIALKVCAFYIKTCGVECAVFAYQAHYMRRFSIRTAAAGGGRCRRRRRASCAQPRSRLSVCARTRPSSTRVNRGCGFTPLYYYTWQEEGEEAQGAGGRAKSVLRQVGYETALQRFAGSGEHKAPSSSTSTHRTQQTRSRGRSMLWPLAGAAG